MKNNLRIKDSKDLNFTIYPNEKIILVTRSHWTSLIPPISIVLLLSILAIFILIGTNIIFNYSAVFLILGAVLILVTSSLAATQKTVEWYLHIYIVSSIKIIEIFHSPLFFGKVTEILLSQVRCTEVDSEMKGIIHHIFDTGDVTITFDRPTHDKAFILRNIRRPNLVCMHLASALIDKQKEISQKEIWFRDEKENRDIFIDDFVN